MALRPVVTTCALGALLLACRKERPAAADSAAAVAPPAAAPFGFAFDAPVAWDDRVNLVDDVPGSGTWRLARMFTYTPRDTTVVPQALLGIFVYDSAAWAAVAAESGPPQGDSLTAVQGQVFIASLPQSNPFKEGTPDFRAFDSLAVSIEVVRKGFRVAQ